MLPPLRFIQQDDTHRLIPAARARDSAFERLTDDPAQLEDLFELEGATNDRLLGESNLLPGISVHELLFGVSYAHIVNAAFTHASPAGGRFNGPERGAWYAAFEPETALAEVRFHKTEELDEIQWSEPETFTFIDYLADFRADFHFIRKGKSYTQYLAQDSYAESQRLAQTLLAEGAAGIVYPSVRANPGTCIVCFRPALILNVRKGGTVKLTLSAGSNKAKESL